MDDNNYFPLILKDISTMSQVSRDLASMEKNELPINEKIDYFCKLLKDNNLFPDVASLEEEKSDEKAVEFREEGNAFFKYSKYFKALTLYNKSICYAASKENLSVGFSNRSAALFMMKKFSECLESIRLAREVGLPQRLIEKLAVREAKCKGEIEKKAPNEAVFVPKIDMPVNEKIPFLAKCLELRVNKTYGRYIVTKEDIPAGKIIAIDEPYCMAMTNSNKYLRCATCLAEVSYRLFPCDNCTQTMFCSKECKEKALAEFHIVECPINGSLFKTFEENERCAFRMAFSAFFAFPDIKTMASALAKIEREQKNVFSFDWTKQLSLEEHYTPIHNMTMKQIVKLNNYEPYVASNLTYHLLQSSPVFSQRYLTTKAAEDILKGLSFRLYLISNDNAHLLDDQKANPNPGSIDFIYGAIIHRFRSLLNHSCSPNTLVATLGTTSLVVTMKNIAAGEQISTSYGVHHRDMDRGERRERLMEFHDFYCECIACVKDFPLQMELPVLKNIPKLPVCPGITFLGVGSRGCSFETARKYFQETSNYIRKYGHHYPCLQIYNAELQLRFCINIMCGIVPMAIRESDRE